MARYDLCRSCASGVDRDALRCPVCSLRQGSLIHRDLPNKKIGGVCAALAREMQLSPLVVRAIFVGGLVSSFWIALATYVFLWRAIPLEPWSFGPGTLEPIPIEVLTTPHTPRVNFTLHNVFDWVHDRFY